MPAIRKYFPNVCKQCGKSHTIVSSAHLCWDCAQENLHANMIAMQTKTGKEYEKWKKAMQKAVKKL